MRVPWTPRRTSQSILKKINPEYSLKGLKLNIKLQHFGHMMERADSLEKTAMMGKTEVNKRREWQRMGWLDGITTSLNVNLSELWEIVEKRGDWCAAVHGVAESDRT